MHESAVKGKVLLGFRSLGYADTEERWKTGEACDVIDLTWELRAGERVFFKCNNSEQSQVIWRLALKKLKPKSGGVESAAGTVVYTDEMLWQRANSKEDLWYNLRSKLFHQRPWVGNRMLHHEMLLDLLGLRGHLAKIPLGELAPRYQNRAWAVLLAAARVKVWLVDRLFVEADSTCKAFLMQWLRDFPGAVVFFGAPSCFSDKYDLKITLDSSGFARMEQ